jgi:hypothetical protein
MNPLIAEGYILLLAVPVLIACALVAWRSTRKVSGPWRVGMTLCRVLAVGGVLLLLLNPGQRRERVETIASSWAIMLDQSQSMAFADVDGQSRFQAATQVIGAALRQSQDKRKIKLYAFADAISEIAAEDLSSLAPDSGDTRIVESGVNLLVREKNQGSQLLGILLLSDGRQPMVQPADALALRAAAQSTPIFPLVLGGPVASKDLALHLARQRLVGFAGQPVALQGELANHRMGPITAQVRLRDGAGHILNTTDLLAGDNQSQPIRFDLPPNQPGYYEYTVDTELREGESDRSNNSVTAGVFVLSERLKVLLLEGEPYWDTKFLSHLLRAQTNISMTAIFRVAKDKFFKVATDTAMTSSDTDVFPQSIEELSQFDLVVLGRGTEYFIDEHRAGLLMEFVKNRGGCLFFARGKSYEGSESFLRELEPVTWAEPVRSDFRMRPLLGGEQVGLFGGLLPERDDALWRDLPILTRAYTCGQLNSFASVLANGVPTQSGGAPFPLLISKRYGSGLVLLINADGLWKWGFAADAAGDGEVYQNLWIQLFQWAVSFAEFHPGSDYLIRTDRGTAHIQEPLRVSVRARAHTKTVAPIIRIYQGATAVQTMTLAADDQMEAGWSGLLSLSAPGIFRLVVQNAEGQDLGAQTAVQILPPPGETDDLSADGAFLKELAEKSGGRVITREDLPELIQRLEVPKSSVRQGDVVWETRWDRAWVLVLLLLFFALEWYMRRRQGLH